MLLLFENCVLHFTGEPRDGGLLPRALDVVFNSISERQMSDVSLKPNMFCDVMRLTPRQAEAEHQATEAVLKMATHNADVSAYP